MSRRRLITGVGAGAAAMAVGVAGAPAVQAAPTGPPAPTSPGTDGAHPSSVRSGRSLAPALASAPMSGWTYRTLSMYAFKPFDPAGQLTFGGLGVYPAGTQTTARAEFELPAGALIKEVEFYVYNGSSSSSAASLWRYNPGDALISPIGPSVQIPTNSGITAYRAFFAASDGGPFAFSSSVLAGMSLPTNGSVQINGVRIGFGHGAGAVGLLDTPLRAYDSRHGDGPIAGGATRTITLPPGVVVPGVTGVLVNVTAANARQTGFLKVYPASGAVPGASALNYEAGTAIANDLVVGVSSGRQVKIYASATTDVILDITGTVS